MSSSTTRRSSLRLRLATLILLPVLVALALALALGTTLLAARLSRAPLMFVGAGWVVLAVGIVVAVQATARIGGGRQPRARTNVIAVGVVSMLAGAAFLLPLRHPTVPPRDFPGMETTTLPSGSTIAYVRVAAGGDGQAEPIVFIHGGPGVADMAGDLAFFRQLAEDGRDVILYDQVGAGHSGRLEDPAQYSLERDVADLKALLADLDVSSPVLVGHSYGGTVAAAFAARHPERVVGLVFLAPGAIRPQIVAYGPQTVPWFTFEQRRELYAALLHPRALLGWLLSQVNVRAAHALTGDDEFDAQVDRTYGLTIPGLYCEEPPEPSLLHGLGFYTYSVPRNVPDLRPALRSVRVPTLILKPQCDYLPWEFRTDLADALPRAQLVYVRGAGHSLYSEQPDAVLAEIRAFLVGSPLAIPAQIDGTPPKDLRGP